MPANVFSGPDPSQESKTTLLYDIAALAFCTAALILALVLGSFHQVGGFGVESDFYGRYAIQAENILSGRPYTTRLHPPGYAVLLAGVSLLMGDLFVAGKIISAFAIALFGLITYRLLKALFDARIALAATILALLALIPHSFLAATDVVGATLILLPLMILLVRPVLSLRFCLLTGICSGIAYLVRSNAVFLILGIGLSILFINLDQEGLRRRLAKCGVFVGAAFLTISPWLIVNWKTHGSPFASSAYVQIAAQFYYPTGDLHQTTTRQAAREFSSLSDVVLRDPIRFLGKFLKAIFYQNITLLAVVGVRFPVYLFAGVGLLLLLYDLSRKRLTFLAVCIAGYLLLGLVGFYVRYYLFLFPLLFAAVAYLCFHKFVLPARNYGQVLSWSLIIVLAAFIGRSSYKEIRSALATEPRHLLEIASFLRSRSTPGELIIGRKPNLAYLAGLKPVFPPENTSEEYLAKAREIGARYIVYSDLEASLWPGLNSLRNPYALPDGFKPIYSHQPSRTLIYEIQPRSG